MSERRTVHELTATDMTLVTMLLRQREEELTAMADKSPLEPLVQSRAVDGANYCRRLTARLLDEARQQRGAYT